MFKGFKLEKVDFGKDLDTFHKIGETIYTQQIDFVRKSLNDFLTKEQFLDGDRIIKSWFPKINADIFLSHSHADEKLVIALAGWLYQNFELTSFIDSCVWGYGNDLIKQLDDQYSLIEGQKNLYSYNKVLLSASHVHMMLATALSTMIDKTECLIFFDTPNATQPFDQSDKTESPWIYSEILFSEIIRKTIPPRLLVLIEDKRRTFSALATNEERQKSLHVKYDVNSSHLKKIDVRTLIEWQKYNSTCKKEKALDKLYELTFPVSELLSEFHNGRG